MAAVAVRTPASARRARQVLLLEPAGHVLDRLLGVVEGAAERLGQATVVDPAVAELATSWVKAPSVPTEARSCSIVLSDGLAAHRSAAMPS